MFLIYLIVVLAIVGVVLWAVNEFVPMPPDFKRVLNVIVILFVLLWALMTLVGWVPGPGWGPRPLP